MAKLRVNGQERAFDGDPSMPLLWYLRDELGLTGTKFGCGAALCGNCTVHLNGEAVRSCIMFAVQADGAELVTVEGLADGDELHPMQQAFHEHHALQCGFCTPGMLIAALDYLKIKPDPTEDEIRDAISAVLCRCTGYVNIVKAVKAGAAAMRRAKASE